MKKKTLLHEVFLKLRSLSKEEKFLDAISLYEIKIIFTKHPVACSVTYLWALFGSSGNENKAYAIGQDLLNKYHNDTGLINFLGYITQWLGNVNNDILKLEESNEYFKFLNKKDEIELNKGKLLIIKIRAKQKKEEEKEFKETQKKKEKELKEKEKRKEKELKDTQHKLKSSRGKTFCVYCGISQPQSILYNYCDGRVNGHNYTFIKDKKGRLKLECKKCGATSSQSSCFCS